MPSLNVGEYIGECIRSVLNQTLKDIEVICVDSGSTDNTLDVLENFAKNDGRVKLIKSNVKSYGHQVNLGINEAKGIYIGIIETDDYISEEMFETLYNLSENNTMDIVKSNFYHLNEFCNDENRLQKDMAKKEVPIDRSFNLTEVPNFVEGHPSVWAAIYLKSFLNKNNIKFVEEPGGGWVDNPFFYETAIKANKIRYTDEAFYYYRVSNPNSSSNNFTDFTLPMRRVLDIFNVFDSSNFNDNDVTILFYNRLFRYIEIILENNDLDMNNLDYDTCLSIQNVLKKVDEGIVRKYLIRNFKVLYYKFSSPLLLKKFEK